MRIVPPTGGACVSRNWRDPKQFAGRPELVKEIERPGFLLVAADRR